MGVKYIIWLLIIIIISYVQDKSLITNKRISYYLYSLYDLYSLPLIDDGQKMLLDGWHHHSCFSPCSSIFQIMILVIVISIYILYLYFAPWKSNIFPSDSTLATAAWEPSVWSDGRRFLRHPLSEVLQGHRVAWILGHGHEKHPRSTNHLEAMILNIVKAINTWYQIYW